MDKNKCPKIKTQFTFDFLKIVGEYIYILKLLKEIGGSQK